MIWANLVIEHVIQHFFAPVAKHSSASVVNQARLLALESMAPCAAAGDSPIASLQV